MKYSGLIDSVSKNKITGWCRSEVSEKPVILDFYINGILIRSRRADLATSEHDTVKNRFIFFIGGSLLKVLPNKCVLEIKIRETGCGLTFGQGVESYINGEYLGRIDKLENMLKTKWHVDHWGNLHVQFGKSPELKEKCTRFYSEVRELFKDKFSIPLYLTGGNLLGLVRENQFLDHDDDVDSSFILKPLVNDNVEDMFFSTFDSMLPTLLKNGYKINLVSICHFHIYKPGMPWMDVLVGWIDSSGSWYRLSGYGGDIETVKFEYNTMEYLGHKVIIPKHFERELEITYGENWNVKDAQYSKDRDPVVMKMVHKMIYRNESRVEKRKNIIKDYNVNPDLEKLALSLVNIN
jgi:hypothetical protein